MVWNAGLSVRFRSTSCLPVKFRHILLWFFVVRLTEFHRILDCLASVLVPHIREHHQPQSGIGAKLLELVLVRHHFIQCLLCFQSIWRLCILRRYFQKDARRNNEELKENWSIRFAMTMLDTKHKDKCEHTKIGLAVGESGVRKNSTRRAQGLSHPSIYVRSVNWSSPMLVSMRTSPICLTYANDSRSCSTYWCTPLTCRLNSS